MVKVNSVSDGLERRQTPQTLIEFFHMLGTVRNAVAYKQGQNQRLDSAGSAVDSVQGLELSLFHKAIAHRCRPGDCCHRALGSRTRSATFFGA